MKINSINNQYQYNTRKVENNNLVRKQSTPAFGGMTDVVVEPLSNLYDKVASTQGFQKFITKFSRTSSFKHLMFAESCFLSSFYMINTLRNKKIKKEQKPQMLINDTLTLGVSSAGAYVLDGLITKGVDKLTNSYFTQNQDFYIQRAKDITGNLGKEAILGDICNAAQDASEKGIKKVTDTIGEQLKKITAEKGKELKAFQISPEKLTEIQNGVADAIRNNKGDVDKVKETATGLIDDVYNKLGGKIEADKIIPGINKLKTVVAFGLIYRYLGPVLVTPLANKLSSKFFDKKKPEEAKATK